MRKFKRALCVLVLGLLVAGLAGCNTIEGVGKDIQEGGKAIEDVVN